MLNVQNIPIQFRFDVDKEAAMQQKQDFLLVKLGQLR